jgi:putative endonuclease
VQEWFLYILRCRDASLYTGITTDIPRRMAQHTGGMKGAKALRGRGPFTLVYSRACESKSEALKLEASIKRLSKAGKESMIGGMEQIQ